jgi:hypothetical protein
MVQNMAENTKQLEDLTKDEFNNLKESGMLNLVYPDAPQQYGAIKGRKPESLDNPNFEEVIVRCKEYLNFVEEHRQSQKDAKIYIFEAALEAVYGSGVFEYLNRKL